jgi:biopolymer transport protein ExbD
VKLRRNKPFQAEVSTTSLNDIMFFLLLFFLIVSTMANPNVIRLMLPKAGTTQTVSKLQITVSVTEDKRIYLDNKEITFDQYTAELKKVATTMDEPTIILRMAQNLIIQDLVDYLEVGAKEKVKIVLATEKKK